MTEQANWTFENPHTNAGFSIPYTVKQLALWTFRKLNKYKDRPATDLEKLKGLLQSIVTHKTTNKETGQAPTLGLCPKLRAMPFWYSEDAPVLASVEAQLTENWETIRAEYLAANSNAGKIATRYHGSDRYDSLDADSWSGFTIIGLRGVYPQDARAQELFPSTTSIIKSLGSRVCGAEFLVLQPGTVLPPHTDGVNAVLACQMGIVVEGQSGLRVRDTTVDMEEGRVVFFDQSFPHSAWNKGATPRVVLLLSLVHPDITDQELDAIKEFYRRLRTTVLVCFPLVVADVCLSKTLRFIRGLSGAHQAKQVGL